MAKSASWLGSGAPRAQAAYPPHRAYGISAWPSATAASRSAVLEGGAVVGRIDQGALLVMERLSTRRRAGSQVGQDNRSGDAPRDLQHPARALPRRRRGRPRTGSAPPCATSTPTCSRCRRSTVTSRARTAPTSRPSPPRRWARPSTASSPPCTATPGLWTAATGDQQPRTRELRDRAAEPAPGAVLARARAARPAPPRPGALAGRALADRSCATSPARPSSPSSSTRRA